MLIIDGHCDSLLELYKSGRSFWRRNLLGHLDWVRLQEGGLKLQFMAIYIEPQYKPVGALCRALELIDYYQSLVREGAGKLLTVKHKQDLPGRRKDATKQQEDWPEVQKESLEGQENSSGRQDKASLGVLLSIEGGEALEGKLSSLRLLFQLGIRSLTLTWNQRNQLADGVGESGTKGGLTAFGREVVREMNRLGMLIDLAHLSESGFWDVLSLTEKPVAVTHTCCFALHRHPRNLTNEQLLAIKNNQGIVGINFYPTFLGKQKKITLDQVVEHLEHAVSVCGVEHVGLGSDFDGIETVPRGLEDVSKLPALSEKLLQRGWKREEVEKIMGGNFLRVLETVLPEQTLSEN
ncbi:MAG TPA: dipeptidase [Peptococcaceae bacterium]|jgi:membrane dipeptidase|nr:membrane dipeptidase [Clostridia bacterium]HOB81871.1 dipeptidase [Peptococcaceae bacterium]HPZ71959.1 dipeptidase [Peptococcaceae bacterium]HQD53839.1 dipeptidase [Peptococcaceae bacterium]